MVSKVPAAKKKTARKKAAAKKTVAVKKLPNLFCVFGTDDWKVKEEAAKLTRELAPEEAGDFGLEVIEGNADNSDRAARICALTVEAIQTLPFFGGDKVVWLKGANFFADTVTGRSETTKRGVDSLVDLLTQALPSEVKVVISASDVDKRRAFFITMKKAATLHIYDLAVLSQDGWEQEVAAIVAERAAKRRLNFEGEALELFVMLAGQHTRQIESELEKLDIYLGERRGITVEDVKAMVSQSRAGVIFELGNAIARRNVRAAFELIDQLLYRGENAVGILLAGVVPKVRNLFFAKLVEEQYRIRAGSYRGYVGALERLPDDEIQWLPKKKDGGINAYPIFLASQEAGGFTAAQLRRGLAACLEANTRLVTTQLDHKTILSQLVIRMLAGK
jgi:DNA polymerase-3 subunit delta